MAKVFDLQPGGLKDGGQATLNEEESNKLTTISETNKEHDDTNAGLKIAQRNKIAAHFMRVEIPEPIVNEIWENRGVMFQPGNEDIKTNLANVLHTIAKSFIKLGFLTTPVLIANLSAPEASNFRPSSMLLIAPPAVMGTNTSLQVCLSKSYRLFLP